MVSARVGVCRRLLSLVRFIQSFISISLLASAAVGEVTAAERFRRDFGWLRDPLDSNPRRQIMLREHQGVRQIGTATVSKMVSVNTTRQNQSKLH